MFVVVAHGQAIEVNAELVCSNQDGRWARRIAIGHGPSTAFTVPETSDLIKAREQSPGPAARRGPPVTTWPSRRKSATKPTALLRSSILPSTSERYPRVTPRRISEHEELFLQLKHLDRPVASGHRPVDLPGRSHHET